jgi:hypothetical protein
MGDNARDQHADMRIHQSDTNGREKPSEGAYHQSSIISFTASRNIAFAIIA